MDSKQLAPVPVFTVVACVSQKQDQAAPAADLYVSDWFRKARAYVEATGRPWAILSALHGLVEPTETVAPYNVTMADHPTPWRGWLAGRMAEGIARCLHALGLLGSDKPRPVVEILAGRLYRERLVPALERLGIDVVVPMKGLGIGEQKRWLKLAAEAPQTWDPSNCYDASPDEVDRRWRKFLEQCRKADEVGLGICCEVERDRGQR